MPVDILAIAAHRDDVELTCAGTLLKAADAGHRTGILDLTAGESGTRGSASLRADEAARATAILGASERRNAGLPDAHLYNDEASRRAVVAQIRHFAPRVVILPFAVGRHPDHRVAAELGRDACFLSGLEKYDAPGARHRPHKILYALSYREDPIKPTPGKHCRPPTRRRALRGSIHGRRRRRIARQGQDHQQDISAPATRCWPATAMSATCRPRTARCGRTRTSPWTGRSTPRRDKHVDAIAKALQGRRHALSRHRPRPRGRGDLLARAGDAEAARRR